MAGCSWCTSRRRRCEAWEVAVKVPARPPKVLFAPPSRSPAWPRVRTLPGSRILPRCASSPLPRSVARSHPPINFLRRYRGSVTPREISVPPPINLLFPPIISGAGPRGKRRKMRGRGRSPIKAMRFYRGKPPGMGGGKEKPIRSLRNYRFSARRSLPGEPLHRAPHQETGQALPGISRPAGRRRSRASGRVGR
jgi:hypothetical protein